MGYGKVWISLLTAVFLAAAVLFWRQEPETVVSAEETAIPISVQVSAEGRTEDIACWENDAGEYYIFLPSFGELSRTEIRLALGASCALDGQPLENGQSCGGFRLNEAYALSYTYEGETREGKLTFLQSAQMPSMHIRVPSGSMDYIHGVKGNKESGSIHIYAPDGSAAFLGNLKSISGRGNGTWAVEKKPYNLVLSGEADLFGLGTAQRWVLLTNDSDASHLRNKLIYDFAAEAGLPYSPGSQWVELYLNGEYAGLYLLCEKNEIHPQRVNLPEENSFLVSLEVERRLVSQELPYVRTEKGMSLRVHHSSQEEAALEERFQSAENAILAEDGIDPVTGKAWTELIDLDSWARKYLLEELFGNGDAGALSQFFYGDGETGKICAGPVWDYDISMGNTAAWQQARPEAFFGNRARMYKGMDLSWYHALCQKEAFKNYVNQLYREEYRPLMERYLQEKLADCAAQVEAAAQMNRHRWRVSSPAEETAYIREYMGKRMAFLDSVWLEGETWHRVLVDINDGSNIACWAVRPGETIPELPDISGSGDAIGWYCRDTDTEADLSAPVNSDLDIYCKRETWEEEQPAEHITRLDKAIPLTFLGILLTAVLLEFVRRKQG